jgi:hypothetical protein
MCCHPSPQSKLRTALICFFIMLFMEMNPLFGRQVGEFSFFGDIRTLVNDTTIVVSDTMVALSERVRVFPDDFHPDTIVDTPSIFFIIDNSTSMSGATGNDAQGNRFTVTSAFIDSLMRYFPTSEVGLAIFTSGLYFDPAYKPGIFQNVTSPTRMGLDSTGAFVPLLTLNQMYGTQKGYEILKEVLETREGQLVFPAITGLISGTNINAGFDAALQAFAAAKFARGNQYIIFFSDGEANRPQSGDPTAFTAATNCPATFTIYFTSITTVPPIIQAYTDNCKINNYSVSDSLSTAWAYNNTTFEAMMQFLMANIFIHIISYQPILPKLLINGQSSTSWSGADSSFTFSTLFALTGKTTFYTVYFINSKNEATTNSFNIQTQNGLSRTWRTPYDVKLLDRDLVFQSSAGATIPTVSRDIDTLQVRFDFTPGDANYTYTQAEVELFNTNATVRDLENLTLSKGTDNFFIGEIKCAVSDIATPSNDILEHAASEDTLFAVFRNSETPRVSLDTLRVSIPFTELPVGNIRTGVNPNRFSGRITIKGKESLVSIEGIRIPSDPNIARQVTLSMKIYDLTGKSIAGIKPMKLFASQVHPRAPVCLSWNGLNNQGFKIARGIYQAVVSIDYPAESKIQDIKTIRPLGIWE